MGLLFSRLNDNRNELSYDEKYTLYAELYEASMEFDQNVAYCDYETLSLMESAEYDEYGVMTEASLKGAWEKIKKWWNKFVSLLKKWWNKLKNWIKSIFGSSSTGSTKKKSEKADEAGMLVPVGTVPRDQLEKVAAKKNNAPTVVKTDETYTTVLSTEVKMNRIGYDDNNGADVPVIRRNPNNSGPTADRAPELGYTPHEDVGNKFEKEIVLFPLSIATVSIATDNLNADVLEGTFAVLQDQINDLQQTFDTVMADKYGRLSPKSSVTIQSFDTINPLLDKWEGSIGRRNEETYTTLSKDEIDRVLSFIDYVKSNLTGRADAAFNKLELLNVSIQQTDNEFIKNYNVKKTNDSNTYKMEKVVSDLLNLFVRVKQDVTETVSILEKDLKSINVGLEEAVKVAVG